MVKAHLRNYSNSYDNSYIDLFGKGEKGDSQLNLNRSFFLKENVTKVVILN